MSEESFNLYFVRHGEVENPTGVRYGRLAGFSLSKAGQTHVQRSAEWLSSQLHRPFLLLSGPLERARETAAIMASQFNDHPVEIEPRLTEAASRLEGLPREFSFVPYVRRHWALDGEPARLHESPREIADRVRLAISDALNAARSAEKQHIVLVSHQHSIQYTCAFLERFDLRGQPTGLEAMRWRLGWVKTARCAPASVTHVTLNASGTYLQSRYHEP